MRVVLTSRRRLANQKGCLFRKGGLTGVKLLRRDFCEMVVSVGGAELGRTGVTEADFMGKVCWFRVIRSER